jgi:hypothetical protein
MPNLLMHFSKEAVEGGIQKLKKEKKQIVSQHTG